MQFAVAHLTERNAVASMLRLEAIALGRTLGAASLSDVRSEVRRLARDDQLVLSPDCRRFTTRAAQEVERDLLRIECAGRNALVRSIRPPAFSLVLPEARPLTSGQATAALLALTTRHRVVGVQGRAGTGKTTMLKTVQQNLADGFRTVGLAPSAAAARELTRAGVSAKTIASFIGQDCGGLDAKCLVVIDEASMVGARDLHRVLFAVERSGARAVLVGDTRQLASVEAGAPFRQLQQHGMPVALMSEIQRQTDATLRSAVEHAAGGNVAASLATLGRSIQTVADDALRHQRIAESFVEQKAKGRETLAVAGTNWARRRINELVRDELKLTGLGRIVTVLERRDLTRAQTQSSLSYEKDDVVEFLRNYESLGVRKGDTAIIESTAPGAIRIRVDDERIQEWRPTAMPNVAAYRLGSRELAPGDEVRFTANLHALGIVNGERATVEALGQADQTITLRTSAGELVTLDANKPLHLDHGYCTTVHASQGQTCDSVLIDADASSVTANESLFYVAISRARAQASIFTDDDKALPAAMSRSDPRTTALDLDAPTPRQAALAM